MKKSLLALAALSAIAGTAQAQSSVTLFGALDAGMYYVNGATNQSNGGYGVLGNTIVSSNWGVKGTEDLGGGLKANFYAESGIDPRNGQLVQTNGQINYADATSASKSTTNTLFDRGLYVGLQGNWGQVNIGNKMNPLFASHAGMLPVSGNSVGNNAAGAAGFSNSAFTHNSITYTLPTMAGFNAELQYGAGNQTSAQANGSATPGGEFAGSVLAASVDYTIGGFKLNAAGQKRWSGGTAISANSGANTTGAATGFFAGLGAGQTTYLFGVNYAIGAFKLGAGWAANQVTIPSTAKILNNNTAEVGVGYQATPSVLLGLNWLANTAGSNLINAQARYAFSKRTQAYTQVGYAMNKTGLNGEGLGNMTALAGSNGGFGPALTGSATGGASWNQLAFGVGLIHTF